MMQVLGEVHPLAVACKLRLHGAKVFEIRWDKTGFFKIVHYEPGDWERTLRAWPAPVPFD